MRNCFFARVQGFAVWQAFGEHITTLPSNAEDDREAVKLFSFDEGDGKDNRECARWDNVSLMKEKRTSRLNAEGQMTDVVLERISRLDHVKYLNLSGSHNLPMRAAAPGRMPQLLNLDLSGWDMQITDRGSRSAPSARAQKISDVLAATGNGCRVANLSSAIGWRAWILAQRPAMVLSKRSPQRELRASRPKRVTDAVPAAPQFPVFKTWKRRYKILADEPLCRTQPPAGGRPFTNSGLASLAASTDCLGSAFWHVSALTADGLEPLADLPNLGFLGLKESSQRRGHAHIAAMPWLRILDGPG